MIVLDTNVLSELMRQAPDPVVARWVRAHAHEVTTTVITRAEILAGIELMPAGRRQELVRSTAATAFSMVDAVLPLVNDCAIEYASIVAVRHGAGRPIEPLDALIASVCRVASAKLATRNVRDFDGIGLDLINPWE